ncbi:MAG: ribosome-associated translation inhibitor RaiA [Ignavibacteria bacterium]|nr:ribosome-associated translation inhibitor RaiA [Ignavibacteria bacterium]
MKVQITSRKFRAKESLKDFIKEEVSRLTKFYDDILEAKVILSFMHSTESIKTAEIILSVPGSVLNVSEESEDFNKSVSLAISKLEKQLKKLKSKKISKER